MRKYILKNKNLKCVLKNKVDHQLSLSLGKGPTKRKEEMIQVTTIKLKHLRRREKTKWKGGDYKLEKKKKSIFFLYYYFFDSLVYDVQNGVQKSIKIDIVEGSGYSCNTDAFNK